MAHGVEFDISKIAILLGYIAKTRSFGLHFCRRTFRYVFHHFYAVRAES